MHLNGNKIGVVLHEDPRGLRIKREGLGQENAGRKIGNCWHTEISAIGAPVYYYDQATQQHHNLTDVTWSEFLQGKRGKFRDAAEQALALRILPPLLGAAKGGLRPLRPNMSKFKRGFELSDELKKEIDRGDLIRMG